MKKCYNELNYFNIYIIVFQLQHSLEAQIAALVSNLQVLQQNHNRQQELQDKEKESKLQQQIEERLKRLEDLQAKMLETQVRKFKITCHYQEGGLQYSSQSLDGWSRGMNLRCQYYNNFVC